MKHDYVSYIDHAEFVESVGSISHKVPSDAHQNARQVPPAVNPPRSKAVKKKSGNPLAGSGELFLDGGKLACLCCVACSLSCGDGGGRTR